MRIKIPGEDKNESDQETLNSKIRYRYAAKNIEGKTFRGTAYASNHDELYALLRRQDLYLQHAVRLKEPKGKPLLSGQLADFCQALSNLLGTGIHLRNALSILCEDDLPKKQLLLYKNILAELSGGTDLAVAMRTQKVFPDLMLGMINSAEYSGNLDSVTARLALHYTREHKLIQQIRSAMIYPCLLAVMSLISLIVIFTLILPEFNTLFDEAETLPFFTRALIIVSNFLVNRWYVVLCAIVLLAVLTRYLLRVPSVRLRLDKWKLKTRFLGIGKLTSSICTARFARTLCNLHSSGVSTTPALKAAFETFGNRYLSNQIDVVAANIQNGKKLAASLRDVDGLQRKLCGVIQVGEETGRLDNMLDFIADSMEYDSEQASKRLVTLLEPVLIIIMSVIIGAVMIGVMYPIIGSYGTIWGSGY